MILYVVQYLSSSVQTIDARTIIFFVLIRSTSFRSKLQKLINAFLICRAHATFIHPTSIHLNNNSMILTKLFHASNSHFFIIGVALSHSRRHFFMVASYDKVKSLLLNLTKFWQHFTLVSKYTTWNWWDYFPDSQVCTQRTTRNALYQNFIKLNKKFLTLTHESTIKIWVSPNCPNGQFMIEYND